MSKFAWVTLTTNDTYSLGALVLAHSLKRVSTAHQLAVLVTPGVSESMRNKLKDVYNVVQEVNVMDSQDAANLALLARPELGITFTKLHCWRLVQFEKCVFLDSDILVIQNCDELFEREEFSAAPDISWPDCFNSGVFVFRPSLETFSKITEFALKHGSFDGGDQGLLNQYFSEWAHKDISKHLPFIYNTHAFATYSYLPAFIQFRDKIKILHFTGKLKPWLVNFDSQNKKAYAPQEFKHISDFIQLWWDLYCEFVHHNLSDEMKYSSVEHYKCTPVTVHVGQLMFSDNSNFKNINTGTNQTLPEQSVFYDPWEDYYRTLEKVASKKNIESNWHRSEEIRKQESQNNKRESEFTSKVQSTVEEFRQSEISPPQPTQYSDFSQEGPTTETQQITSHDYHEETQTQGTIRYEQRHEQVYESQEIHFDRTDTYQESRLQEDHYENRHIAQSEDLQIEGVISDYRDNQSNEASSHTMCSATENISIPDTSILTQTENLDSQANENVTNRELHFQEKELNVDNRELNICSEDLNSEKKDKELESSEEPSKPEEEAGLAGALAKLRLGEPRTPEQEAYEQHMRRQCWESGNIDYAGKDSFDNIWRKITETLEAGSAPKKSDQQDKPERLTSADIQDGKTEYDPETKSTIVYKKIPKGYQQIITTPQPNGTMKTQTKTFYDPVPVPADEIETEETTRKTTQVKKDSKKTEKALALKKDANTTVVTRKIPNGREEVTTTINPDGTKSVQIKTYYDAEEEEITETTEVEEQVPGETKIITKTKTPKPGREPSTQLVPTDKTTTIKKINTEEDQSRTIKKINTEQQMTQEYKMKSERTVEESRRFTQTTEVSGKTVIKKKGSIQEESVEDIQNIQAITEKKEKKKRKPAYAPPAPPEITTRPGSKTTVDQRKVPGGLEYVYTTILEDGRIETSVKTVYEEEEVEMTEEEITEYHKQLKEAEKHKNVTKTTTVPSKVGTKKVIPSENPGDVTTVETVKIEGGTEYHYTTITAEGIVKKSSKTVYDPVPVEGDEEEEELIEEYEEEIIEPGEPIVTTTRVTKPLNGDPEKKKLGQDAPASKKKEGKKSVKK